MGLAKMEGSRPVMIMLEILKATKKDRALNTKCSN